MKSDSAGIFMAAKTSEETGMRGRVSEHQGKETAEARRSEEIAKPPWTLERSHSDPNAPPSLWPFLRPIMYIMSTRVSKERSYDRFPPFWPQTPTTTSWIAVLMPLNALDSCGFPWRFQLRRSHRVCLKRPQRPRGSLFSWL